VRKLLRKHIVIQVWDRAWYKVWQRPQTQIPALVVLHAHKEFVQGGLRLGQVKKVVREQVWEHLEEEDEI